MDSISQRTIAAFAFFVITVAILGLLIKILTRIREPPVDPEPPPPDLPPPDLPPTVKVMVLGLEGSGKTMMMAGMYYRWAFGNRHGVVLKADGATEEFLSRLVARIEDPDGGLPGSTREGDVVKADFTFMVNIPNEGTLRSFGLRYIDYAGEHIRRVLLRSEGPPDPEVTKDLAEADIVLGVLDGGQVARAMRDKRPSDIANVLTGLARYLAGVEQKTIHIVVSKWDLVVDAEGAAYPLSEVVEFLKKSHPFRQFCESSPMSGVRRIIPTSAFGLNGFVRVDDHGAVYKDRKGTWQPFMAGNAVACSVPDVIETEWTRAREAYNAGGKSDSRRLGRALTPLLKVVLTVLNSVTGTRIDPNVFTYETFEELSKSWGTLTDRFGKRSAGIESPDFPSRELLRQEAIRRVLQLFAESIRELEEKFHESKIKRPRPPRRRGNSLDSGSRR